MPRAIRIRALSVVGLLLGGFALSSCLGDFNLGKQVSEAADSLEASVPSLVGKAGKAFEDSVGPRLERTAGGIADTVGTSLRANVDSVTKSLEATISRLQDSLKVFVAEDANRATQKLLAANVSLLSDSVDKSLERWLATVATTVEERVGPAANRVGSAAAKAVLDTLSANIGPEGKVGKSVVNLADSVVTRAIQAIGRTTGRETPWWVYGGIGLVVLALIASIGRFILSLHRNLKNSQDALRVVGLAIYDQPNYEVAGQVKEQAKRLGIEPWLNKFLRERRILLDLKSRPRTQTEGT